MCDNLVDSYPSRIRKFCSQKCSSKIRSELKKTICVDCKKGFSKTSSNQERCGNQSNKKSCSYTHKRIIAKDRALARRYGITREIYNGILKKQHLACAICKGRVKLVVDHCHKSSKIRGLLCHHCNTGIGMFRDSVILLKRAEKYLTAFCVVNK